MGNGNGGEVVGEDNARGNFFDLGFVDVIE